MIANDCMGAVQRGERAMTMRSIIHASTTARREGGLVGMGREDALLFRVQKITGLVAVTPMGSPSWGNLFKERHIKHGFLGLLPLKPHTRDGVGASHRPSRIDTQGGNGHPWPTTFAPYHIPGLELFHRSISRSGEDIVRSPCSMPPHARQPRHACSTLTIIAHHA